jgi:hypothetical protein
VSACNWEMSRSCECKSWAMSNTEKKNCIHTTMIQNLNIKLKNICDKYFKKEICSINRDLRKYDAYS